MLNFVFRLIVVPNQEFRNDEVDNPLEFRKLMDEAKANGRLKRDFIAQNLFQ